MKINANRIAGKTLKRLEKIYSLVVKKGGVVAYADLQELFSIDYKKMKNMLFLYKGNGYLTYSKVKKGVVKIEFNPELVEKYLKDIQGGKSNSTKIEEQSQEVVETEESKVVKLDYVPVKEDFKGPFGVLEVIVDKKGDPWFVASDVAKILGYDKASRILRLLDDDEKLVIEWGGPLSGPHNKKQAFSIISESGLYTAMFASKKAEVKPFKKWVTNEVLPTIRKHGAYMTADKIEELLSNPDMIIELATELKEERAKRIALSNELKEVEPYIEFGKATEVTEGSIKIGDWVKSISREHKVIIGRNNGMKWLRDKKYFNAKNYPYQRYVDNGYFEVYIRPVKKGDITYQAHTTYITTKGQLKLTPKIIAAFKK